MGTRKLKDITIMPNDYPSKKSSIGKIIEENLEIGKPTLPEASIKLNNKLETHRRLGTPIIKIIHGYGSSGKGGTLRDGLRKLLKEKRAQGIIKDYVPGEEFARNYHVLTLIETYPQLEWDQDLGRNNRGITIVVL